MPFELVVQVGGEEITVNFPDYQSAMANLRRLANEETIDAAVLWHRSHAGTMTRLGWFDRV